MAQQIKLKRSAVAGRVPTSSSLALGEVAINTADGKLFFQRGDSTIQSFFTTNALITGSLQQSGSDSYFLSNIGIGTESPSQLLHITDDQGHTQKIQFGLDAIDNHIGVVAYDTLQLSVDENNANGNSAMTFRLDGQEAMRVSTQRYVGIGTTSPTAKLHVSASSSDTAFRIAQPYTTNSNPDYIGEFTLANTTRGGLKVEGKGETTNNNAPLLLYGNDTAGGAGARVVIKGNTDASNRNIMSVRNSADTELLVVRGAGNVGIGTTSPSLKLDVSGTGRISSTTYLATNAGNVGIGTTSPTEKLTVEGNISGSGNLYLDGAIFDSNDTSGSVGQILTSIAGGTAWENVDTAVLDEVQNIYTTVKNVSGGTLAKGTPVHAVTGSASGNINPIIAASASVASTMPATFILNEDLDDEEEGQAIIAGSITKVDTSAFEVGDVVYVGESGGYTNVKPTGSGNLIQNLGVVTKVHASNGSGVIYGSGRSNDVPNLPVGKVWVGSDNYSVTSSVVHLDETNGRLGINAPTPGNRITVHDASQNYPLRIGNNTSNVHGSWTGIAFKNSTNTGGGPTYEDSAIRAYRYVTGHELELRVNSTASLRIDGDSNVGIGNTSPTEKLTVEGNVSASGVFYASNGSQSAPAYTFADDPDTGIFRYSPNQLELVAGGSTGIRFGTNAVNIYYGSSTKLATTSTGAEVKGNLDVDDRLGIGRAADSNYLLSLSGSTEQAIFQFNAGVRSATLTGPDTTDSSDTFKWNTNNNWEFRTDNSRRFTIHEGVGIGIGDVTPAASVHISGSGLSYPLILAEDSSGTEVFTVKNTGEVIIDTTSTLPLVFKRGGTENGRIFQGGGDLYIGTGDTNIRFNDNIDALVPANSNQSNRNNAISLGSAASRFSNAYLAGLDVSGSGNFTDGLTVTGSVKFLDSDSLLTIEDGGTLLTDIKSNYNQLNFRPNGNQALVLNLAGHTSVKNTLSVGKVLGPSSAADYQLDVSGSGRFTDGLTVTGSILHDGDLTVTGTVTAQEFKTEFVSASIIYQSGSTKFGDTADDTHSFTGSLELSGSDLRIDGGRLAFKTSAGDYTNYIQNDGGYGMEYYVRSTNRPHKFLNTEDTGKGIQIIPFDSTITNKAVISVTGGIRGTLQGFNFIDAQASLLQFRSDRYNNQVAFHFTGSARNTQDTDKFLVLEDAGTELMTVLNSGNVGIGTTSPQMPLHVAGRARLDDDLFIISGDPTIILSDSNNDSDFSINVNGGLFSIKDTTNSASRIVVNSTGNVGIGTTTPTEKLHVSGNILVDNGSASALHSSVGVTTTTAGSFTIYSVPTGSYDGAFFDYTIKSGSNGRAGSIQAMWMGSEVNFNETVTTDFGDTSGLDLDVSISGGNMVLTGSCDGADWNIKAVVRAI